MKPDEKKKSRPSEPAPAADAPPSPPTPARETRSRARDEDLDKPRLLLNREASWLEFNARVLDAAREDGVPLLERLKFLSIFSSNLDEFFMIRVANLRELETAGIGDPSADGRTPAQQLETISLRAHQLVSEQSMYMRDVVLPGLAKEGIVIERIGELDSSQRDALSDQFHREFFPVLTPMTVDPSHPFPHLPNQSLNIVVAFRRASPDAERGIAIVGVPPVLDRLLPVEGDSHLHRFVLLDELIMDSISSLFPGTDIEGFWRFRITRNSDLTIEEQEVENLMKDIERELRSRVHRRAVRLEVDEAMPRDIAEMLLRGLDVPSRDLYRIDTLLHIPSLMQWYEIEEYSNLRDAAFNPRLTPRLASAGSIFSVIRESDLLLHHPYESFSTVVELLQVAARDPKVLAIKQTLYRTRGDSAIMNALREAAQNGKQVTVVVELKARFDERNNIVWAQQLERAGVHVVYGIVGLKTHAKALLVVRREDAGIVRYVHLSTGNYNTSTARLYTDIGLMSCRADLAEDVSHLFNILTGYNAQTIRDILDGSRPRPVFTSIAVAPFDLKERMLSLIRDEIRLHRPELPGLIRWKLNAISDPDIIVALYRASRAGVTVELAVRGICCLRPSLQGISDNIRVVGVVDRFLEHSRIYHFRHGGDDLAFISSADMMSRNLERRVETLVPVADGPAKSRLLNEILRVSLADNSRAHGLDSDGAYRRLRPAQGEAPRRSQERFIELARAAGVKSEPYEDAVLEPEKRRSKKKEKRRGA